MINRRSSLVGGGVSSRLLGWSSASVVVKYFDAHFDILTLRTCELRQSSYVLSHFRGYLVCAESNENNNQSVAPHACPIGYPFFGFGTNARAKRRQQQQQQHTSTIIRVHLFRMNE